uniref:Uncharacterized protein n=1 Tax=Noccaea caerulescens TaxID=107243 RepID=A0A1J3GC33_NOCCA
MPQMVADSSPLTVKEKNKLRLQNLDFSYLPLQSNWEVQTSIRLSPLIEGGKAENPWDEMVKPAVQPFPF